MPFDSEVDLLHAGAFQKTAQFIAGMRAAATSALQKDLADEGLEKEADAYIARANAIALGMAEAGAVELAEKVYEQLVLIVDQEMERTGKRRHRGALFANRAAMNISALRYDVGIPLLQYVVRVEDPNTYGVAPEDSFANVLRRNVLDDPALELLLQVVNAVQFPMNGIPSKHELEGIFRFLGESRLVLYGVLLGLRHNIRFALRTNMQENYLGLRMFDAFRAYAFFLEELAGRLVVAKAEMRRLSGPSHPSGIALGDALKRLFGEEPEEREWWPRLKGELETNSRSCRRQHIDKQNARLVALAESQPATVEDTVVTSIAVLNLIRNIGAHEIYAPEYLVAPEIHLERALAWLTAAGILIFRESIHLPPREQPLGGPST